MATGIRNAVDYSYGPPDIAQAHAAGIRLFCRYLSPSSGKDFNPTEIRTIHSHGDAALGLWEGYAADALKGYSQGQSDGRGAVAKLNQLYAAVGYKPKNKQGVAFAVDFDVQPSQYGIIARYFQGVRSVVGPNLLIGCYGHAALIDHLVALKLIDFGFQTYAWSGGVVSPNAHLYQFLNGQSFCGGNVDYCEIRNLSKLGAWFPPGSPNNTDGTDVMEEIMSYYGSKAEFESMLDAKLKAQRTGIAQDFRVVLGNALRFVLTGYSDSKLYWNAKRFPAMGGVIPAIKRKLGA